MYAPALPVAVAVPMQVPSAVPFAVGTPLASNSTQHREVTHWSGVLMGANFTVEVDRTTALM